MHNGTDILVVEDSSVQAEMLRRLLASHGYAVTVAGNGREALALLQHYRPALIISDIIMPEMDGYELIREIKRHETMRHIPVLLLTTLADSENVVRGLEAHADGYLTKPYDPDFLVSRVRSTLETPLDWGMVKDRQEVRITVDGRPHTMSIDPHGLLNLVLSTYENALRTNQRLTTVQAELKTLNRQLEQKVSERTAHLESEIARRDKAEQALLESSERLSSIVESAQDPIIGADSKGRIIAWNAAATRIFGYEREEALGQSVTLLMPERFVPLHERAWARAVASGAPYLEKHLREVSGRRKDGTEFPLESAISCWKSEEGIFFTALLRDLTERKLAEKAIREGKERIEALLNAATDAAFLLDIQEKFLALNRHAAEKFGKTAAELVGTKLLDSLPAEMREDRTARIQQVLSAGTPFEFEDEWQGRFFHIRYCPVYEIDGGVGGIAVFESDITARKRSEEELRIISGNLAQQNEELTALATELAHKNQEAQTMAQQLWQAAKLATIGELAASIAHELNNPLAIVSLRTEGMVSKTPPDHPHRRSLEIMAQEIERMGNLVANLLQFSRQYGKQISTINPCEELDKTLELVQGHLKNHGIEVKRHCLPDVPPIGVDRQQLRQVLLNLITNGTDAMPAGGALTIRGELVATEPAHIRIQISDTGEGIAPENLKHVMEPFFTTKPEGRGTGLGLPICKRIVEDHGGKLNITSEVGKGTNVSITLPVAQTSNSDYLRERG